VLSGKQDSKRAAEGFAEQDVGLGRGQLRANKFGELFIAENLARWI